MNETDVENRVRSIDFTIKEKILTPQDSSAINESDIRDEEVPF